jgi:hypothetical protein
MFSGDTTHHALCRHSSRGDAIAKSDGFTMYVHERSSCVPGKARGNENQRARSRAHLCK